MKAYNTFIFFLLLSITYFQCTDNGPKLSSYICELERYTKWDAVVPKWKESRKVWVEKGLENLNPKTNIKLMLIFEDHVTWEAVDSTWRARRLNWINDCKQSTSDNETAKLLIEFESHIKWSAVDSKWRDRREGWIEELSQSNF